VFTRYNGVSGAWSDYVDITRDVNGSNCSWNDVRELKLRVRANLSSGSAYVAKAELRVQTNISKDYDYNSTFTDKGNANTTITDTIQKLFTGLKPGWLYFYRYGITTNYTNSSSGAYSDQYYLLTRPKQPANYTYAVHMDNHTIRINWTTGPGSNQTLIRKGTTGYPTAQNGTGSGTLIYNGTKDAVWINFSTGQSQYLRAWGYTTWHFNPTLFMFSGNGTTGLDISIGGLLIDCFDDDTHNNLTFKVTIFNTNGSEAYTNGSHWNNNTLVVNVSGNLTTGPHTIYVTATNHNGRTYEVNIQEGMFIYIPTYLSYTVSPPATNETYLYRFTIHNELGNPVESCYVEVKKQINASNFSVISNGFTDSSGYYYVWLNPGQPYIIFMNKTGFIDQNAVFIPSTLVFEQTFVIKLLSSITEEIPRFKTWIIYRATMQTNNSIYIEYHDLNDTTINTSIRVYEIWNFTETLVDTDTRSGTQNFSYYATGINTSRNHRVTLYFNNSLSYDISSPYSIYVYAINGSLGNQTDLNTIITNIIGPPPVNLGGNWVLILIVGISIIPLAVLGPFNAPIGVIGTGILLGFMEMFSWLKFAYSSPPLLIALVPIIIVVGVVFMWTKGDAENRL